MYLSSLSPGIHFQIRAEEGRKEGRVRTADEEVRSSFTPGMLMRRRPPEEGATAKVFISPPRRRPRVARGLRNRFRGTGRPSTQPRAVSAVPVSEIACVRQEEEESELCIFDKQQRQSGDNATEEGRRERRKRWKGREGRARLGKWPRGRTQEFRGCHHN